MILMGGRNKKREIERSHNKPIREVIIESVDRNGSVRDAAKELGVTQGTLSTWIAIEQLALKTIIVPRDSNQSA